MRCAGDCVGGVFLNAADVFDIFAYPDTADGIPAGARWAVVPRYDLSIVS